MTGEDPGSGHDWLRVVDDAPTSLPLTAGVAAAPLPVIGIGEDGWDGLGETARAALRGASTILGSRRQLDLLPGDLTAAREPWPSPMGPRVNALAASIKAGEDASSWAVLASGDPMLHGIGATLAGLLAPERLHIVPAPSAFSLACARLGWPQHATPLVSRVADPATPVAAALRRAGRAVVYVAGPGGADDLALLLRGEGLGNARVVVMERLGGPHERLIETTAEAWSGPADALHLVAVELTESPDGAVARARVAAIMDSTPEPTPSPSFAAAAAPLTPIADAGDQPAANGRLESTVPGLPDELFGGDGQLTRAEIRAVALAALAPRRGELLWDVGSGSGTIAIEWCRGAPGARAIAIERRDDRAATIDDNATALGAGRSVEVVLGAAPLALEGLPQPDAIFIGGGPATPGLIDACWTALAPGGRLVANAVTLEGEQALSASFAAFGGRLVRLEVSRAEPLGSFTGWKPQRPVVQWSASRPHADESAL